MKHPRARNVPSASDATQTNLIESNPSHLFSPGSQVYAKRNDSLLAPDAPCRALPPVRSWRGGDGDCPQPNGPGEAIRTRSRQWLPIFERICTLLSSSPFQRKLMHRTLTAGVAMHVLDRTNGEKLLFSEEEIATLSLDKPNAA